MRFTSLVLFLYVVTVVFISSVEAKPKKFIIRKEDSQVGFSIYKWVVFKEEGRFKDFDGSIVYDPENPSATTVDVKIYVASVDSRNEGRDGAIKSRDFLDAVSYPTLTFKSMQIRPKGKDSLYVQGVLTMKGRAHRVTLPVRVTGTNYLSEIGTMVGFETTFVVNREDYGIATGSDFIGKDATIHLLIGASSKD